MTDREKIMNDFEHEVNKAHGEGWDFVDLSTDDAKKILVLLKEQEPVEPDKPEEVWLCGNCGEIVGWDDWVISTDDVRHNYCPGCGRKVKWDD